jgi:hypothetical protein
MCRDDARTVCREHGERLLQCVRTVGHSGIRTSFRIAHHTTTISGEKYDRRAHKRDGLSISMARYHKFVRAGLLSSTLLIGKQIIARPSISAAVAMSSQTATIEPGRTAAPIPLMVDPSPGDGDRIEIVMSDAGVMITLLLPELSN